MYYVARTVLGWTELEFWTSTPRKLRSQVEMHASLNDSEKKDSRGEKQVFIDSVL